MVSPTFPLDKAFSFKIYNVLLSIIYYLITGLSSQGLRVDQWSSFIWISINIASVSLKFINFIANIHMLYESIKKKICIVFFLTFIFVSQNPLFVSRPSEIWIKLELNSWIWIEHEQRHGYLPSCLQTCRKALVSSTSETN